MFSFLKFRAVMVLIMLMTAFGLPVQMVGAQGQPEAPTQPTQPTEPPVILVEGENENLMIALVVALVVAFIFFSIALVFANNANPTTRALLGLGVELLGTAKDAVRPTIEATKTTRDDEILNLLDKWYEARFGLPPPSATGGPVKTSMYGGDRPLSSVDSVTASAPPSQQARG